jgi:hypothetical protein
LFAGKAFLFFAVGAYSKIEKQTLTIAFAVNDMLQDLV